jgi:hypothetical protein
MSLFRRQTDEVFTTLQQVQRRLSQHTEGADALVRQPPTTPTYAGANVRLVTNPDHPVAVGGERVARGDGFAADNVRAASDVPPVDWLSPRSFGQTSARIPDNLPEGGMPSPRGVRIGTEVLATMAVVWLLTVVVAFIAGQQTASTDAPPVAMDDGGNYRVPSGGGTAGVPGGGGDRSGGDAALGGRFVLVLKSARTSTPEIEKEFQSLAERLNQAVNNPQSQADGYRPWFGVRRPDSGGIQLVFGEIEGRFGIDHTSTIAERVYQDLKGKYFRDAMWVQVR